MTSSGALRGRPPRQIFDKYIAALGGAQRLAAITSYIATGKSVGYEGLGGEGDFSIYAKSPNQKTTEISYKDHPERGTSLWAFDGSTGWIKTPRGLLGEYEVTGAGLDGTRFDAQMAFPGRIKTLFTNWRVGQSESLGDRDFNVVQGGTARGLLVTLFFDTRTNLLAPDDYLHPVADRPRSVTGGFRRLSRRQRHQVPLRINLPVAGRQVDREDYRRQDERRDRRREIRQTVNVQIAVSLNRGLTAGRPSTPCFLCENASQPLYNPLQAAVQPDACNGLIPKGVHIWTT